MENIILCESLFLFHKTYCSDSGLGRAQDWIKVVKCYFEEESNTGQWEVGEGLRHAALILMMLVVLGWGPSWESLVSHDTHFLY